MPTTSRTLQEADTSTAVRVKISPRRLQPTKVSDLPSPERQGAVASTTQPAAPPPALQYHHTAYVERERIHLEREKKEETCAAYIWNTGEKSNEENCILLCKLVGIFSKCLPNMPRTYISRLVFDRRHRSVIIRHKNGRVVAGITYRPFHERKFAEIAFCAVAQTLQGVGFWDAADELDQALRARKGWDGVFSDVCRQRSSGILCQAGVHEVPDHAQGPLVWLYQGLRWRDPHGVLHPSAAAI